MPILLTFSKEPTISPTRRINIYVWINAVSEDIKCTELMAKMGELRCNAKHLEYFEKLKDGGDSFALHKLRSCKGTL